MSLLYSVAPKSLYKALPAKEQVELAAKTGKQYAVQSAYHLYNLLADTSVVQQLPKEQFGHCLNPTGQIRLQTRLALALRHFYYALMSRFEQFGKTFATLVPDSKTSDLAKASAQQALKTSIPKSTAKEDAIGLATVLGTSTLVAAGLQDSHEASAKKKSRKDSEVRDTLGDPLEAFLTDGWKSKPIGEKRRTALEDDLSGDECSTLVDDTASQGFMTDVDDENDSPAIDYIDTTDDEESGWADDDYTDWDDM